MKKEPVSIASFEVRESNRGVGMNAIRTFRHGALFVSLTVLATSALARSSTDPLERAQGKLGQDLFMAVNREDQAGVHALLKRGADPNAQNALGLTPLFFAAASGQVPMVEILLQAGAKLDPPSPYGTPLTAAAMTGAVPAAQLLLQKGADLNPSRADGITVLMLASRAGTPEVVAELLRRK